jgi:hypothetical protein
LADYRGSDARLLMLPKPGHKFNAGLRGSDDGFGFDFYFGRSVRSP